MAENFGQEETIQACRDCFKALGGDVMSETNLPVAKECAAQYWPSLTEGCSDQIAQVSSSLIYLISDFYSASDWLFSSPQTTPRLAGSHQGAQRLKLNRSRTCPFQTPECVSLSAAV